MARQQGDWIPLGWVGGELLPDDFGQPESASRSVVVFCRSALSTLSAMICDGSAAIASGLSAVMMTSPSKVKILRALFFTKFFTAAISQ